MAPLALAIGGLALAVFNPDASTAQRVGGVAIALPSLLVLASYFLRFTTVLDGDTWTRSRPRRFVRLLLKYSWHIYLALIGLVAVFMLIDWLIHR